MDAWSLALFPFAMFVLVLLFLLREYMDVTARLGRANVRREAHVESGPGPAAMRPRP